MNLLTNKLFRLYQRIIHSIALYPTLIALGFLALLTATIAIEYQPWLLDLKAKLNIARNADNARLILGTLVGGILSLMVFSFTMVMVVLNSAAASLSPRVIPSLISSKSHQKTLGVYLGTILYALLLITMVQQGGPERIPSLGVFLSLCMGLVCLGLFIHFIRSISHSIQVDFILSELCHATRKKLQRRTAKLERSPHFLTWPVQADWHEVQARRSGYFKALNAQAAHAILQEQGLHMAVLAHRGFFVMPGTALFCLDRKPTEDISRRLLDCFDFFVEEYASTHFFFGFKQISEIAVKALSPGINDPGTAARAIDMLCMLFAERLKLPSLDIEDSREEPRLFYRELPLDRMLFHVLGPIRNYGCGNAQITMGLLEAVGDLLRSRPVKADEQALRSYAASVVEAAAGNVHSGYDRSFIDQQIEHFNAEFPHSEPLRRIGPGR